MFSIEKINSGRQLELDIARGFAVLFMILIHSQIFFANQGVIDSGFGAFNDFVGMVPSAPMFMFLLGIGINYSKKTDPKLLLKRGLTLILAGYLLNFLRGFLPGMINAFYWDSSIYFYEAFSELMYVDILQFSGLTLIMFAIFKLLDFNLYKVFFIGIFFAILNVIIPPIQISNFWISSIVGLFFGTGEHSYFPFLTWSFYPIMGYIFGSFLIRCNNKKKFYGLALIVAIIIFFGGSYFFNELLEIPSGMLTDQGYYHHIITDNVTFTALIIMELSILLFISPIVPNFFKNTIYRWSKNVTAIFFIHWIIITWLALFIEVGSLNMLQFILLLGGIIGLSDFLAYNYEKFKKRRIYDK